MEDFKIIWVGNKAYVGRVNIGQVFYDGLIRAGSSDKYAANSNLPNIKTRLGNFKTEDEAKSKVEYAWNYWLKMLSQENKLEGKQ